MLTATGQPTHAAIRLSGQKPPGSVRQTMEGKSMDVYTAFGRTVATTPKTARSVFLALFATWWVLLAFFYTVPGVDIAVANHFFTPFDCANASD